MKKYLKWQMEQINRPRSLLAEDDHQGQQDV